MRRVAIVQARMKSSRLPGKPLLEVAGAPMLAREIERLGRCRTLDEIVIATTTDPADDPIAMLAERCGVRPYRGSENDVLARYVGAARDAAADLVIRVTGDCPLIDPRIVDLVAETLTGTDGPCDFASNVIQRSFPRGLDCEALFTDVLARVDRLATSASSREHVTPFIYVERPDLWVIRPVVDVSDNSDLRWTVDTKEDLDLVRRLYLELTLVTRHLDHRAIVAHVRSHPELLAINAHIQQKPL